MPRGYRRIIIAVVGIVLIGAAEQHDRSDESNQAAARREISSKLDRIASALEQPPSGESPDPGCEPGQDNRQSDLCAQWKAADAADKAAWWAGATFWLAIAGMVVGAGTLVAAVLAAGYAKQAADHAKSSVVEAQNALTLAREVARDEKRPWLIVDNFRAHGVKLDRGSIGVTFSYALKNLGESPAFDVMPRYLGFDGVHRNLMEASANDQIAEHRKYVENARYGDVIAPGQSISFDHLEVSIEARPADGMLGALPEMFISIFYRARGFDDFLHTFEAIRLGPGDASKYGPTGEYFSPTFHGDTASEVDIIWIRSARTAGQCKMT
jgi:hypothetical protein